MIDLSYLVALMAAPLVLLLLLPALSEAAGALWRFLSPGTPNQKATTPAVPKLCILVPAHNEEVLIGRCVRSLMEMSRERVAYDIFVVADNCTDSTVVRASEGGAQVLERHDVSAPGKPKALQWAIGQVPIAAYDAIVIVDADSLVHRSYAAALASHAPLRGKAVQSYNGIANRGTSWLSRLAGLLIAVRYDGQFVHKQRARLNCPLANGMLIGTDVLERYGWPADSLTENWEVYARLTTAGVPIEYAPEARLGSHQAEKLQQSSIQRSRWQAGRWQVLRKYFSPLVQSRVIGWRQKLDAIAELTYPGPVVHATLAIALAVVLLLFQNALTPVLVVLIAASLLPLFSWTIWAIQRDEDRGQLLLALARLPFYAVWRVVVLFRSIITGRRALWLRSPRQSAEVS